MKKQVGSDQNGMNVKIIVTRFIHDIVQKQLNIIVTRREGRVFSEQVGRKRGTIVIPVTTLTPMSVTNNLQ